MCVYCHMSKKSRAEFLKFIGSRGQKIMRSANKVGNAGPHVCQTFLNDVFTFVTEVGNADRIVNTGTIFYLFLVTVMKIRVLLN